MSSLTRLEVHRGILQQQVLPAYEQLGSLTVVYLLGSLTHGYTEEADLDCMMVWDGASLPEASVRESLVVRFDERRDNSLFVVDYLDIHAERFVIAGQEYNIGHLSLASFQAMIESVLDGRRDSAERILDPLVAASGFYRSELLLDRDGHGQQLKNKLATFPIAVKQECQRVLNVRRQAYLTDLRTFARREDWFMFDATLVEAVRTTLRALFALQEMYYPGDKWLRQSIVRFGLPGEVLKWFDRLWEAEAAEKVVVLEELMDLVEKLGAGS